MDDAEQFIQADAASRRGLIQALGLMIRIFCVLLCLATLLHLPGCRATQEETVYDWVADLLLQDRVEVAVASSVDSRWFKENSLASIIAKGTISRGSDPPWLKQEHIPLIERLFEQNREDGAIQWQPRDRRVKLIDGDFRAKPRDDQEVESMCFSNEVERSIGVTTREGKSFKPYFSFSRIAFSEDGQHAAVKIALACAPVSGAFEGIAILRRDGNRWVMDGGTKFWVS